MDWSVDAAKSAQSDELVVQHVLCKDRICCEKCNYHSEPNVSIVDCAFVVENESLCCPQCSGKMFDAKCGYCEHSYLAFIRDKNRILCTSCDYPVHIYRINSPKRYEDTWGENEAEIESISDAIQCPKCSNRKLDRFEWIPIDQDLMSFICYECNNEQILVEETTEAETTLSDQLSNLSLGTSSLPSNSSYMSADNTHEEKGGSKKKLKWLEGITKHLSHNNFRRLWNIASKLFLPIAKAALILLAPLFGITEPVALLAANVIELIHVLLQSGYPGDKNLDEIIKDLPFLSNNVKAILPN